MPKRLLATALLALAATPALAQDVVPPGEGMIDQPCPAQNGLWFGHAYVKANDWAWLCRFREDNAALTAPPQVVFIGDSITEGWWRADQAMFERSTGFERSNGAAWANRGISGQTSPQMLLRFWQDVIALHPRVVHIMAGTNDIAGNTGPNRIDDYKNNIRAMGTMARANGIAVVIASLPPADHFSWKPAMQPGPRVAEINAWLKDYAASEHFAYADYHAAMAGESGAMKAEFTRDGVHPEPAGYAVMRPIAERAIAEALAGE